MVVEVEEGEVEVMVWVEGKEEGDGRVDFEVC
jgi:hypothetical protein